MATTSPMTRHRLRNGFSQQDLSEQLPFATHVDVSMWERGLRVMPVDVVEASIHTFALSAAEAAEFRTWAAATCTALRSARRLP